MSELKKTTLATTHETFGARMVEFGGWWMPVQYSGIIDEHQTVRRAAGVFDISHMGEVFVSGPGALAWLNGLLTNDVNKLAPGQGHYTLMLNTAGGVIDDLYLYRLREDSFFLVINASMIDVDGAWMKDHLPSDGVQLDNRSAQMAGLALQGPKSVEIYRAFFGPAALLPARNQMGLLDYQDYQVLAGRTGYTGEDGFEFFFPAEQAPSFWNRLLELGRPFGLKPCGLGARDTLRLEMGYPLNGNDLSPERTPLEAGLGVFVSLIKPEDFPGKTVLLAQKTAGVKTKLAAFRMTGKSAPPRPHYPVFHGGMRVGEIASGTQSPSLGLGIGMAYLDVAATAPGTALEIEIRGSRFPAEVVKKPFYLKTT